MVSLQNFENAPGKLWLVGAGPGDPELLTLRGARAIGTARLIVHDGLVSPAILALARADAKLISVAKRRRHHTLSQPAINALLIDAARDGADVLRLKGGDPFLFGRGGEEAEAARAAGIAVEVVPGISAGFGAAAAAGIPLTHRGVASVVSFVSGQAVGEATPGDNPAWHDWARLAGSGHTLVIYMGLANAEAIAEALIAGGLAPDTPVAVIENATLPQMRVLRAPLAGLGRRVAEARVESPALIIIGAVVALSAASVAQLAKAMASCGS